MNDYILGIVRNGGSDPDAVWHHRSDGSRHEAWFGDRSTGSGTFGANLGRAIVTSGTLRRTCTLSQRRGPLPNYFGLAITDNGDDAANDFNKYKML